MANAGLVRAKDRGAKLGRPKVSAKVEAVIKERLAGILRTARTVGTGAVQRIKAEIAPPSRR